MVKLYTFFFLIGYSGKVDSEYLRISNGMRSLHLGSAAFWMPINIIVLVTVGKTFAIENKIIIAIMIALMFVNYVVIEIKKEVFLRNAKGGTYNKYLLELTKTSRFKLFVVGYAMLLVYWIGSITIFNFIVNPIK